MTIEFDEEMVRRASEGRPAALRRIKHRLAELPPTEAFDIFRASLKSYERTVLRQTTAASQQAHAMAYAKHYIETARAGIAFVNQAPQVIGTGNQRDLVWQTRTAYLSCFENAKVWGGSAVVEAAGAALFDFEDWELASVKEHFEYDPRIFRSSAANIYYIDDGAARPDIVLDRAFPLLGPHTRAFGDWLWGFLPKFGAALQTGRLPPVTVLVEDYIAPTQKESIERMLPPNSDLLTIGFNVCCQARELWCAPSLLYMPVWPDPDLINWDSEASHPERWTTAIAAMAAPFRTSPGVATTGRRLFLSRRQQPRRQMLNWPEVETLCAGLGFDIIIPETLSFAEQVAAVRSADYIVGPDGSAFFLCYYARPGTKICLLSHPELEGVAAFTAPLDAIGIEPVIFTGPFAEKHPQFSWWSEYAIDCGELERFLRQWLASNTPSQHERSR